MADDNGVLALFDDIAGFLDNALAKAQDSPDSLTTHFSTKVVEARSTIVAQIVGELRRDGGLVDRVGKVVKIMSAEHRMPSPAAEFLQLTDKPNALRNVLLKSDKDLQIARSKIEKSLLETKMRENLQRGRSIIIHQTEVGRRKEGRLQKIDELKRQTEELQRQVAKDDKLH